MNDYWNDPPDEPDPPQCPRDGCEGWSDPEKERIEDGVLMCECDSCTQKWFIEPEPEYGPPEWECDECGNKYPCECMEEEKMEPEKCPHGNKPENCDHCDFLGDIAFDSAREARIFGS